MGTVRYFVTQEPGSPTFGFGSSDKDSRQKAYSTSPFLNGYDDVAARRALFQNVNDADGVVDDGPNGYYAGNASLTFRDAPDLSTVTVGGGGLPGTPFSPNIAAPGEGNGLNASAIPSEGVAATVKAVGGFTMEAGVGRKLSGDGGFGNGNGLTSPSKTTDAIVAELSPNRVVTPAGVRTLTLGRGSKDSFRI